MSVAARYRWATIFAGLAVALCLPALLISQDDTQERWIATQWTRAFVHFFPQPDDSVFAAYRFLDGPRHETPEYSFTITQTGMLPGHNEYAMVADVREASPQSLYEQLAAIYRRNPRPSDRAVSKLLTVKRFRISETKCPALEVKLNDLVHRFRFLPPETDRAELAGPSEDLWANDGDISVSFSIDAGGSDRNFPLIVWARETRQILDTCYEKLQRK